MKIIRNLEVPTGNILVVQGSKGKLEMLSLGDYGKEVNLKCDSMGLTRELGKVVHQNMLSLEEKWVITISSQYGCSIGCKFCDVPKVGAGINATLDDLINQVLTGIKLHPEVETSKRLNIHFARMGEPTYNPHVLSATRWLKAHIDPEYTVHPVVSTMMPKDNEWLETFIHVWMRLKNRLYRGEAGLQLSINSTDTKERYEMFRGKACSFEEISRIMWGIIPSGRKITLNFAIADYKVDPEYLRTYFSPENYIIKLTPMHKTKTALHHGIKTSGDYTEYTPYKKLEEDLKLVGYDVLVFIASEYEDLGRITCGNAILSGTLPEVPYKELTILNEEEKWK